MVLPLNYLATVICRSVSRWLPVFLFLKLYQASGSWLPVNETLPGADRIPADQKAAVWKSIARINNGI
ncbi:hypothetical protein D7S44_22335 [Pantoea piersonii]|nr:hypothetical protein D7S44_22335 [Pantoea piersonii]